MGNRDIALFERFAPVYDYLLPAADGASLQRGLDRATRPVERVLDVGGGTGRGVRALSAPQRVVVDPARRMLSEAQRHGVEPVQGDGSRLPVRTDSVDAVLVVDALHHIADQRGVVEEAKRALAPGGVLVVSDFDPTTLLGRLLVRSEHLVGFESTFHQPDRLRETLANVGFEAGVVDRGFGYTVVGRVPACD
jgi:demethylmenaquinone methyltransferase/2-methoxy-6-polyprenyl-1,4-benzoquinol methylase